MGGLSSDEAPVRPSAEETPTASAIPITSTPHSSSSSHPSPTTSSGKPPDDNNKFAGVNFKRNQPPRDNWNPAVFDLDVFLEEITKVPVVPKVNKKIKNENVLTLGEDNSYATTIAMTPDFRVRTNVNGKVGISLIDTGATVSAIHADLVKELGLVVSPLPKSIKVSSATGSRMIAVGVVETVLSFPPHRSVQFPVTAIVFEALAEQFIIGRHFLWKFQANVSMKTNAISLETPAGDHVEVAIVPNNTTTSWEVDELRILPESVDDRQFRKIKARLNELQNECPLLLQLLAEFRDVVASEKLGCVKNEAFKIELTDPKAEPIKLVTAAKMNPAKLQAIQDALSKLEKLGVIRKSKSPWAFRVVAVRKDDGTMRICIDYTKLNALTKGDAYPSVSPDVILDCLTGRAFFSKLDAEKGYHQIEIEEESIQYTAFSYPMAGLYEFTKLSMGLKNAVACFQRVMDEVLKETLNDFTNVLVDDILVYSFSYQEHLAHLREVLRRLREKGFTLNLAKCGFALTTLTYLGFIIDRFGIHADPEKIKAIKDWLPPTSKKMLRSFIGSVQYLRRFVPKCADVLRPLTDLTGDEYPEKNLERFWTPQCQEAFERVKEVLTSPPILSYPDWSKPWILETDASDYGVSGVLLQEQIDPTSVTQKVIVRPIAYYSAKLNDSQQKYDASAREALAIVKAVQNFKHYFGSQRVTVVTDHWAHQYLMTKDDPHHRNHRWRVILSEYDIHIVYRKGAFNHLPDALSRMAADPPPASLRDDSLQLPLEVDVISANQPKTIDDLKELAKSFETTLSGTKSLDKENWRNAQRADPELIPIIEYIESDDIAPKTRNKWARLHAPMFQLINGLLYFTFESMETKGLRQTNTALVVPASQKVFVLKCLHDYLPDGAHLGIKMIHPIMKRYFWWKRMFTDLLEHVETCNICQQFRTERAIKAPLLPYYVPTRPWEGLAIDALKLPRTQLGHDHALIAIELCTGYAVAIAVRDLQAATVYRAYERYIFTKFGYPKVLISDNGSEFSNSYMEEVCAQAKIDHRLISPYNPQGNNRPERFNRVLIAMLAATFLDGSDWTTRVHQVTDVYNRSAPPKAGHSRFYMVNGYEPEPALLSSLQLPKITDDMDPEVARIIRQATTQDNLETQEKRRSKARDKVNSERKQPDVLPLGRLVWLADNVTHAPHNRTAEKKLAPKRLGPYVIMAVTKENVTYRVRPLGGNEIFTRNIKDIVPFKAPAGEPDRLLPEMLTDPNQPTPTRGARNRKTAKPVGELYVVEKVKAHKWENGKLLFNVKWIGYDESENTWEPELYLDCPQLVQEYYRQSFLPVGPPPAKREDGAWGP